MRIFQVPYRWMPRTFFPNIKSCVGDVFRGARNVIRWIPVIWDDFDWDWAPLARIMEYKLRRMSRLFANGNHVGCEKDSRRMLICANLLKRLADDDYFDPQHPYNWRHRANYDREYCFKLMSKHFCDWWD